MSVFVILWVIFAHWFADFVCQTHWQASNKSKNWRALFNHVFNYNLIMVIGVGWVVLLPDHVYYRFFTGVGVSDVTIFGLVTFVAHFATDAITSRISSRLFLAEFESRRVYDEGEDGVANFYGWFMLMRSGFNPHNFFVVIGFDQFLHYAQLFLTIAWLQSA